MRRLLLTTLVLPVALGAVPRRVSATDIAYNARSDGLGCPDVTGVVPFVPFSVYIVGRLFADAAATGITGAEFRATGFDPTWFVTSTPNPAANINIGDPVSATNGGCNLAFAGCQAGPSVLLYSIQILALAPIVNRPLGIDSRTVPSNPNFSCPVVTLCDAPVFTLLCVRGGNGGGINLLCYCGCIAVENKTWSSVKELYSTH